MIPFASQRGGGRDLATHLMNAHDNEYLELADVRGAIADDLHGAFAEWETQARAMTKCRNYLYSLSINPDPAQGPMPRALYDDYIARVEAALGLEGQPRAVVFHIKEDKRGLGREHCHVVWSRIDVQDMKAIHMAFDHDTLMGVTRQFARDHGIELAPGYHKLEDRGRQTHRQLSLSDKAQQDATGLTREDRAALVTELWRRRDTPAAFVKALEHHGYVLAEGKRPYVLVDIDGHINSLPKLIDDKATNTAAIRAFLGEGYSGANLPTVDEARALAAQHRQALKDFTNAQARADRLDQLKQHQTDRRAKLEREIEAELDRHKRARRSLHHRQMSERNALRSVYLGEMKVIRQRRHEAIPRGLAGFLAKVTGMELVRRKLHKHQDKKRYDAYRDEKQLTQGRQRAERDELRLSQEMQALDLQRKHRALDQTEKRERRSLETSFKKQQSIHRRAGYEHMPSFNLDLRPPGRRAVPHKAKNRHTSSLGRELDAAKRIRTPDPSAERNSLKDRFGRAARGDTAHTEASGEGSESRSPEVRRDGGLSREFKSGDRDNERGRKR